MLGESKEMTVDAEERPAFDRSDIVIAAIAPMPASVNALQVEVFPASADQLGRIRQMVWDMSAGHAACGTATLLSGELAANAIEHSGSPHFGLALGYLPGDLMRVVIADAGCRQFPRLVPNASGVGRGRGLRLVDALAWRWGVIRGARAGAAVWFEIKCRPVAPLSGGGGGRGDAG